MFNKNTFKSKTFWLGIVTVAYGAVEVVNGGGDQGVQKIIIGMGLIFGRDAISKKG